MGNMTFTQKQRVMAVAKSLQKPQHPPMALEKHRNENVFRTSRKVSKFDQKVRNMAFAAEVNRTLRLLTDNIAFVAPHNDNCQDVDTLEEECMMSKSMWDAYRMAWTLHVN